jgi:hypothetical protein
LTIEGPKRKTTIMIRFSQGPFPKEEHNHPDTNQGDDIDRKQLPATPYPASRDSQQTWESSPTEAGRDGSGANEQVSSDHLNNDFGCSVDSVSTLLYDK